MRSLKPIETYQNDVQGGSCAKSPHSHLSAQHTASALKQTFGLPTTPIASQTNEYMNAKTNCKHTHAQISAKNSPCSQWRVKPSPARPPTPPHRRPTCTLHRSIRTPFALIDCPSLLIRSSLARKHDALQHETQKSKQS